MVVGGVELVVEVDVLVEVVVEVLVEVGLGATSARCGEASAVPHALAMIASMTRIVMWGDRRRATTW